MGFSDKYGPWALIAGASEGTGRAFARRVAAQGLNCILVARREAPLKELAEQIRSESGVECVTASVDLAQPDACDRIVQAVGDREVGLYISNAGADPHNSRFLDLPVERWLELIQLNNLTAVRCCHHFGGLMAQRGRGGILLVGSGACWGGTEMLATYSAVKAFDLCFAESLWAELNPQGVDVLFMALSVTDTPALQKLLDDQGRSGPSKRADPDQVAELGLQRLPHGPTYNWGPLAGWRAGWRRTRVRVVGSLSKKVMGG